MHVTSHVKHMFLQRFIAFPPATRPGASPRRYALLTTFQRGSR
jgi:hypothetical protein